MTNTAGTTAPPAVTAVPTTLTLGCGQTGQATVVGGTGSPLTATSTHPRVTALIGGSVLTITRVER